MRTNTFFSAAIITALCSFVAAMPLTALQSLQTFQGAITNVAGEAQLTAADVQSATASLTEYSINPALKAAGIDAEGMTAAELIKALTPEVLAKLTAAAPASSAKLEAYGIELNSRAVPRSPFDTTPAEVELKQTVQAAGCWADFSDADLVANQMSLDKLGWAQAVAEANAQTEDPSKVISSAMTQAELDAEPAAILKPLVQPGGGDSSEGGSLAKLGTLGTLNFAFSDLFAAAAEEEGLGKSSGRGGAGGRASGSKPPHRRRSFLHESML